MIVENINWFVPMAATGLINGMLLVISARAGVFKRRLWQFYLVSLLLAFGMTVLISKSIVTGIAVAVLVMLGLSIRHYLNKRHHTSTEHEFEALAFGMLLASFTIGSVMAIFAVLSASI